MTRVSTGIFNLPFEEQIAFFRQKTNLPSEAWNSIWKEAHDRAFIVAGATKVELINDFRLAIDQAISEGKSLQWFRKEFDAIVAKHGWTGWTGEGSKAGRDWRTRIIYSTNLASSHAAGRWQQLTDPDLLAVRPFWKYIHSDTVLHPRPIHKSWHGVVLRYDDPWWKTHFAPNGWNCFTPDTLVSGDFEIGLKSFYSGKIFKFITRSGADFTVTANHPILSEQGWVEAKTLKKGDNLLRYTGIVDSNTPMIIHNQKPPTTAKQWFESLACDAFGICKIASFDFHGDTEFRKGDVYVSGADSVLMNNFKPLPLEQLQQGNFKWADNGSVQCKAPTDSTSIGSIAFKKTISLNNCFNGWSGISRFVDYFSRTKSSVVQTDNLFFKFVISGIGSLPSRLALSFNCFRVLFNSFPFHNFRLAHCAPTDVSFVERVGYNASANAISSSKRFFTFASEVSSRNFTAVKSYFFRIASGKCVFFNQFFKRKAFDSIAFTDFCKRYHGQVVLDDIVSIEVRFYSGHVYTFQSENNVILANGIVTHNCRCRIKAVRPSEYNGKPAPNDGFEQKIVNGKTYTVPKGIDVGWDYAPSAAVTKTLTQLVEEKAINYPPAIQKALRTDLLNTTPTNKISNVINPRGSHVEQVAQVALQAIDTVHKVPNGIQRIPLKLTTSNRFLARYSRTDLTIEASVHSEIFDLSLVHEIGHLLDDLAIGEIGIPASKIHPLLADWRTASANSLAITELTTLLNTSVNELDSARLRSYLTFSEQWARSYAQYIALRSGHGILNQQLTAILNHKDPKVHFLQWQSSDFATIATSMDKLFSLLGWSND